MSVNLDITLELGIIEVLTCGTGFSVATCAEVALAVDDGSKDFSEEMGNFDEIITVVGA